MDSYFIFALYFLVVLLLSINLISSSTLSHAITSGGMATLTSTSSKLPSVFDPNIKIELTFQKEITREGGTLSPVSSMTFLNVNDLLLLNKNDGTVHRVLNGTLMDAPLLDVNVSNKRERGMLGIDVTSHTMSKSESEDEIRYVFIYFTESERIDGSDSCKATYYCVSDEGTVGNNLYRYELKDDKLINPKLLLHLPAWPAPAHNGGVVKIGPDNNLYLTVGDFVGSVNETSRTKAQNYKNGTEPDGRGGILTLTQDGKPVSNPILGNEIPLSFYYAYGIRNSFGIDFDPVTHMLWDSENGPDYGDEINLVEPGFNSGWYKVQGLWVPIYDPIRGGDLIAGIESLSPNSKDLVNFEGKGKYSSPEFVWNETVGPSQIEFLNSDKYTKEYKNDLFVGDTNHGYLYHFDLSDDRRSLVLGGTLADKVANNTNELKPVIIGEGFGQITDLEVGPDGYLYVLTHDKNLAKIFKLTFVKEQDTNIS